MSKYSSEQANILEAFVQHRIASNRWSSVPAKNLIYFDRYCSKEFPNIPGISQHMIDRWCRQREKESKLSQINRCYPVLQLVKYLIERGDHSLQVPEMPPSPKKSHVPHAFSEDELSAFFHECDKRIQAAPDKAKAFRALTVAVLFRLLYSSGMRTTEARLLRTLDVDLENAVINIRETKGDMQHYVALHQDVVKILSLYNQAAQRICPNRNIFFPGKGGEPLSASMLEYEFHKVWDSISTAKAVPYDFRHPNVKPKTQNKIHYNTFLVNRNGFYSYLTTDFGR